MTLSSQTRTKAGWGSIAWMLAMFLPFVLAMVILAAENVYAVICHPAFARIYDSVLSWLRRHYYYYDWLKYDLEGCESILELGCGSKSPLLHIGYGQKADAIDIWQPYVDKHNEAEDYRMCWQADILKMDFPERAYDAVVMFDVLEHLPREKVKAMDLFGKMEKCARKKVIFFTPNGYVPNDEVDGDPYQAHLSAWWPADYQKRGYEVVGGTGIRCFFGKASLPKRPHILFYTLGMLSQPVVYYFPKLAWHSYAVKEVR